MLRRFVLAAVVVALTFTFAYSEVVTGKVSKVEKDTAEGVFKVTYFKGTFDKDTKKMTYDEKSATATTIKDAKVTKGAGKGKAGDPVDGGFGNEMFTKIDEKGITMRLTIADDGDNKGKITEGAIVGGKKKKDAQ
jgi:hypothetical protein